LVINRFDNSKEIVNDNKSIDVEIDNDSVKEKKLSLVMVGDNLIHDKIYNYAYKNGKYDFNSIFEFMKPVIKKYDLAYYNQETILGGSDIGLSSYPAFNSPFEVGDAMIDTGFNLVSLATNHTMDSGERAVLASRSYCNSKSDVLSVGSYSSEEERNKIDIREKNGIKYTMLNYTYGTNGISVPSGKDYLVNIWPVTGSNPNSDSKYQNYKSVVKEDIDRVKDKVDLLIVAMHWGIEYESSPNSYQEDMANYLSSLGVNIIIGTHPHVVQPVTYVGDTLVIYSLGNFLSAHEVVNIANRVGLMSMVDITLKDNKIELANLNNELLYTYYTSSYGDIKVIPFSEISSDYLSNYEEVYNRFKSVVTKLNTDISVVPLK
jgi:poly-gamma-glutamate synthesis protein (capsule biosynthesis protein)